MKRPWMLWLLVAALLLLAAGGLYGGVAMLVDPSGAALALDTVLAELPVDDYILPGLFLTVVMGGLPFLLAFGLVARPAWSWAERLFAWSHHYWAWTASLGLVAVIAFWLALEGWLIGFFPITYATAVVGMAILLSALAPGVREEFARAR